MRWLRLHWKSFSTRQSTFRQKQLSKSNELKILTDSYEEDEYFRATGACETVQGLADLVSMTLQNDDVQDFDVRWDHAPLAVSEMPSDPMLEGLYKSKSQNSAQLRTVMTLCDQEVARNNGTQNYQQLENCSETSYWSDAEKSEFESPERCCGTGFNHQESKRKQSQCWKESGRVFSVESTLDNVPMETPVVSVMTLYWLLETEVVGRDDKEDRLLLHPTGCQSRLTGRRATRRKVLTREVIKIVVTSRVSFGSFPCVRTTSLRKVVFMATNTASDMLGNTWSPTRSWKKVVRKDQVLHWRSLHNWVVCLKILIRESLTWTRKIGNKTRRQILQKHLAPNQNSGKKGSIARYYPKVCASWA